MKKNILSILALAIIFTSYSQFDLSKLATVKYKENRSTPSLIKVGNQLNINKEELAPFLKQVFQLKANEEWIAFKTIEDQIGFTNIKYQLHHNDLPVFGATIVAHLKNGRLENVNGSYFNSIQTQTANITEEDALKNALESIQAKTYYWEIPGEEEMLKKITGDPDRSYYPKGKLIYTPINGDFDRSSFALTYEFEIYAKDPEARDRIYVNAQNGSINWNHHFLMEGGEVGTAVTGYSDTVTIVTDSIGPNDFILRDCSRGDSVVTLNNNYTFNIADLSHFHDDDNNWDSTGADQYARDGHWGSEMSYDYFFNTFGRNSYDGNGAVIYTYIHYGSNYGNANWNGFRLAIGDGNGFASSFTALDIMGHELSHGVTEYTANLIYQGESGALNESYSDIFGNSIEMEAKPLEASYLVGEDIGNPLRNMADPQQYGDPDTYQGNNWASTTGGDNGGVHTNSGVQNYWYYLMIEGGTGINDNGHSYSVNGLGRAKAEQIAYRSLELYLTASSDYEEARMYSIEATNDLYGMCSYETEQVTNAWYAVGVGEAYDSVVTADFTMDRLFTCEFPVQINFTNLSTNTEIVEWTLPGGVGTTQENPSWQFDQAGSYEVELIASNSITCFEGPDTLIKTIQMFEMAEIPATDCQPFKNLQASGVGITRVKLNTIDHSSMDADEGYKDFTCDANTVLLTETDYQYEVWVGNNISEVVKIFIDLNYNGSFESNEMVDSIIGVYSYYQGTINIANLLPGTNKGVALGYPLRMRVMSDIITNKSFHACDTLRKGQAEDYTIMLIDHENYPLGIKQAATVNKTIELYPNPANDVVFVNLDNLQTLEIRNILGQLVKTQNLTGTNQFRIGKLEAGVYTVKLTDKDNHVYTTKLVKSK